MQHLTTPSEDFHGSNAQVKKHKKNTKTCFQQIGKLMN